MFFHIISSQGRLFPPTLIDGPSTGFSPGSELLLIVDGPEDLRASLEGIVNNIAREYFDSEENLFTKVLNRKPKSHLAKLRYALVNSQIPSSCFVMALSVTNDFLYVAASGKCEISIKRNAKTYPILTGKVGELLTASGKIKLDDEVRASIEGEGKKAENGSFAVSVIVGHKIYGVEGSDAKEEQHLPDQTSTGIYPQGGKDLSLINAENIKAILRDIGQKLYLNRQVPTGFLKRMRTKHLVLALVILLSTVLLASIYYSVYIKTLEEKENKFNTLSSAIETSINEAYSIRGLNLERANNLLKESEKILSEIKALNVEKDKTEVLESKLAILKDDLLKKVDTKFETVVDLATLKIKARDLSFNQDSYYVLSDGGQVFSVSKTDKKVVPLAKVEGGQIVRGTKDKLYVYAPSGIYRIDGNKEVKIADKNNKWVDIVDMFAFNNNVYLLDQGAKAVWKYVPGGGGLALGGNGIGDDSKKFLKKPSSVAIDGNIWVTDGTVYKFLLEKKEDFGVKGFDQKISDNTRLFAADDGVLNSLLLLDKEIGRVLQFNKNGQYISEYHGPDMKDALAINFSVDVKRVIILTPTKILSFVLQ